MNTHAYERECGFLLSIQFTPKPHDGGQCTDYQLSTRDGALKSSLKAAVWLRVID